MPAVTAVTPPEPLFSYGRAPDVPEFVLWGLVVAVILIMAEYARRSSSNR